MKLTKKELTHGIKFRSLFCYNTVYTINLIHNYVETDILFYTKRDTAVRGNQYSIESITDKYLKIWDIQFGEKKTFKVKLENIKIVNIEYRTL